MVEKCKYCDQKPAVAYRVRQKSRLLWSTIRICADHERKLLAGTLMDMGVIEAERIAHAALRVEDGRLLREASNG